MTSSPVERVDSGEHGEKSASTDSPNHRALNQNFKKVKNNGASKGLVIFACHSLPAGPGCYFAVCFCGYASNPRPLLSTCGASSAVLCASSPSWPGSPAAGGCTSPLMPAGGAARPGRWAVERQLCYYWIATLTKASSVINLKTWFRRRYWGRWYHNKKIK